MSPLTPDGLRREEGHARGEQAAGEAGGLKGGGAGGLQAMLLTPKESSEPEGAVEVDPCPGLVALGETGALRTGP